MVFEYKSILEWLEKYKNELWGFKPILEWLQKQVNQPRKQKEKRRWRGVEKREINIKQERLQWVPENIKDIAEEKYRKDIESTERIRKRYKNLEGDKPSFFPFFCACKWAESLKRGWWSLIIQDFSTLKRSNETIKSKNHKYYKGLNPLNWRLFIINKTSKGKEESEAYDTPIWMWSIMKAPKQEEIWVVSWVPDTSWQDPRMFLWADKNGSNKSELWFSVIKDGEVKHGSVWDYLILQWKDIGINDNMENNQKYAHYWIWSMWCVVAPNTSQARNSFFKALKNKGTVFTYAPNKDYFKKTTLV